MRLESMEEYWLGVGKLIYMYYGPHFSCGVRRQRNAVETHLSQNGCDFKIQLHRKSQKHTILQHCALPNNQVVFFVALGALTYGYAFSVFSTSIGEPGFFTYFNLTEGSSYSNSILGAINALFSLGAALGALSIAWLPDKFGRKWTIIIAGTVSLIGGALVAGSAAIPMLVVVRLLHGVGVGMCITITPLYLSEVAPPAKRGLLAGMNASGLTLGYFISAWVGYAVYYAKNKQFQWRFPLAISCVFPLILLIGSPWIPESPRWLLLKGRNDEAWKITERLHHDPNDQTQMQAREEFYQMQAQTEFDQSLDTSLLHMFRQPSLRKRILLGCGVLLGGQSCGPLVINSKLSKIRKEIPLLTLVRRLQCCPVSRPWNV
jgi:MFS family permease